MTYQQWAQKLVDLYLLGYEFGVDVVAAPKNFDRNQARSDRNAMLNDILGEAMRLRDENTRLDMAFIRAQALWAAAIMVLEDPVIARLMNEDPAEGDQAAENARDRLRWLSRAVMAGSEALRPPGYPRDIPSVDEGTKDV